MIGFLEILKEKIAFRKLGAKTRAPIIIGVPGIDSQHIKFFNLCDALLDYLKKEPFSPGAISKYFNEIIELLKDHFSTEENLFEIIGFPKAEEHKAEHVNFMDQILRQETILKNSDKDETAYFISTFREAFVNHIIVFDKPYTGHIEKLVALGKKFKISTLKAQTLTK